MPGLYDNPEISELREAIDHLQSCAMWFRNSGDDESARELMASAMRQNAALDHIVQVEDEAWKVNGSSEHVDYYLDSILEENW